MCESVQSSDGGMESKNVSCLVKDLLIKVALLIFIVIKTTINVPARGHLGETLGVSRLMVVIVCIQCTMSYM